jgi:tRNA A-37 threonylcarbamoyl transferase component Bud32
MSQPRVERITHEGQPAWRKHYGPAEHQLRLAALRGVARWMGVDSLLPPVPLAGELACRAERAMIERLAALGVRVPRVLAAERLALVLSDVGTSLSDCCKQDSDPLRRAALIEQGFDALRDLHARGGYVSQAFARNLTVSDEGIGFIDLEQDPLSVMSLPSAQARDVLFFVHSTARFLPRPAYAALLRAHLRREDDAVVTEVIAIARRLAWLAPVTRIGGKRARDVGVAVESLAHA